MGIILDACPELVLLVAVGVDVEWVVGDLVAGVVEGVAAVGRGGQVVLLGGIVGLTDLTGPADLAALGL
jgi:hypothetical protein